MTITTDLDDCPHCEGQGAYWDDQTGQPDEPYGGRFLTCHQCGGYGWVIREPCIACGAPITVAPDHRGGEPDEHDAGCPVVEEVQR